MSFRLFLLCALMGVSCVANAQDNQTEQKPPQLPPNQSAAPS